jgi:hypothetical protein
MEIIEMSNSTNDTLNDYLEKVNKTVATPDNVVIAFDKMIYFLSLSEMTLGGLIEDLRDGDEQEAKQCFSNLEKSAKTLSMIVVKSLTNKDVDKDGLIKRFIHADVYNRVNELKADTENSDFTVIKNKAFLTWRYISNIYGNISTSSKPTNYEQIARKVIANKYPITVGNKICEQFEDYIEEEKKLCTDPNFYKTFLRVMSEVCSKKKEGNYDTGVDTYISGKFNMVLEYCKTKLKAPTDQTKFDAPKLSDDCLTKIMQHLVDKNQLSKTDAGLWLYWFNRNPKFENPTQLNWSGTPTMLANVMSQICGTYQTVAAKAAIKDVKITNVSKSKYKNGAMYKAINQIMTINQK